MGRHSFRPGVEMLEDRSLLSGAIRSEVLYNISAYPSERQGIAEGNSGSYPYLGQSYEVWAPSSSTYNCISYTLGYRDRWISQRMGPPEAPLAWMDRLYGRKGYTRLPGRDTSLVPGFRKVVLYGFTDRHGKVTSIMHAELQNRDGSWSSKLGDGPLIHYSRVNALAGPMDGHPIAVYIRPAVTMGEIQEKKLLSPSIL